MLSLRPCHLTETINQQTLRKYYKMHKSIKNTIKSKNKKDAHYKYVIVNETVMSSAAVIT